MGKIFSMKKWLDMKYSADDENIILYFCGNKDDETSKENPGKFVCSECYKIQTPDKPFYADDFFTRELMNIQGWLGQEHCDICGKLIE